MTLAIIKNGVVINRVVAETWPDGVEIPQGVPVDIGWLYDGETFTAPAQSAAARQREGDAGWFWLRLFTATEQGTWNLIIRYAESLSISALAADPWLSAAFNADRQIAKARTVSLDSPSVIAGVSGILRHTFALDGLSLTVLANDTRRDEVLAGLIVA